MKKISKLKTIAVKLENICLNVADFMGCDLHEKTYVDRFL